MVYNNLVVITRCDDEWQSVNVSIPWFKAPMWHGSKSTKQEFKFLNNEKDFYLTKVWVPWLHNAKKQLRRHRNSFIPRIRLLLYGDFKLYLLELSSLIVPGRMVTWWHIVTLPITVTNILRLKQIYDSSSMFKAEMSDPPLSWPAIGQFSAFLRFYWLIQRQSVQIYVWAQSVVRN